MLRLLSALLVPLAFVAGVSTVKADGGALDRILSKKKIVIAVQNDVTPYSLLDSNNKLDGLDIEVGRQIAKDLGVEAEFVVVTGANRIPALVTNQADITIATLTLTPQRAAVVSLTAPYTAVPHVVIGPKAKEIKNWKDMKDVKIGVPRGSFQDQYVTQLVGGNNIRRFEDDATTFQALASGQVEATALGITVAKSIIEKNPDLNLEIKFEGAMTYPTIGTRHADYDLRHWINTWIFYHKTDGFLEAMHRKWLKIDMPELPSY
ncbi:MULTISPECIES: transporter substrate-binding domain-containing protein [unclassified Chelatococcus]|uniref:transporter substrate-binding domain-containing protein n=1 Tax=unclassified Chelatococcus TaxID=2638111 RepID=UPI001BD0DD79|nr:transporter substrate-binding domain-containing protein [Chelatococcus sp.]MBS7741820.1 transporter substrate-binding domain-containing protein [Chelatococcus sp. HY11]CAH1649044.1 Amino acid ABC transporter substrate-binding protein (PAAT family) [Hyphomicrobiales bacterium]MBX3541382.1 transporter substrate-binding domain-containing protein [Chelatococcus sp.]MCO5074724.1 transporter substrate-binding domain-containing protein [Chelatococcus sp.]CAH1691654.1 Amino acid ABC transporter sub